MVGEGGSVSEGVSSGELTGETGPVGPDDVEIAFSWDFTLDTGEMFTIEKTKTIGPTTKSSGGTGHEPPTIGKALDGVRQVVD